MQEWIIAMLVISVLLILRDMAKTIFSEMKKSAAALVYDQYPQKEKMQRYAESFQKLANSFYETPYRKEYLSSQELEAMAEEVQEGVCRRCHLNQVCWKQHSIQSYQRIYDLLRIMEEQDEEALRKARADLTGVCVNQGKLMQELQRLMERERQNLIWNNKLLENRMAVAEQLQEVAQLMKTLSRDLFDFVEVDRQFREEVEKALKHYIEGDRKAATPLSGHENALFLSTQKRRMGIQAVENMVKKYARQVTPTKKITPHKLRSTYGTSLYKETGDIYLVADVLGHKDVNTTKKHYAAIDEDRRRQAASAVHLRN